MIKFWQQFCLVFLAAFAPFIGLLLRGVVWGSDSFAFLAVACGQEKYSLFLSSPGWFTSLLHFFNCNIFLIGLTMFVFYFLALIGLWVFGKRFFIEKSWFGITKDSSWKYVFVLSSITPLFFIEFLRFENDFFGWTLSFIALGLFTLVLSGNKWYLKITSLILACLIGFIALSLWQPSIFVLLACVFLINWKPLHRIIVFLLLTLIFLIFFGGYIISSFNILFSIEKVVAEEVPLVGLIFILHIVHFVKRVPKELFLYSLLILGVGLLKSKYIFLSVPFLVLGLMKKEELEGLIIRGDKIPLIPVCCLCLIGLVIMSAFLYPTQTDLTEMKEDIALSKELGIPLYNSWGEGWTFVYLGYDTNYKISYPDPDWNNLVPPYIAYSKTVDLNCEKINTYSYKC